MTTPLLFGAVLALTGCYTYRPLTTTEPAAGTQVSAQLTSTGSRELAGQVGPDVLHLEGKVLHADSATWRSARSSRIGGYARTGMENRCVYRGLP
jgi:hypothetical protein